MDDAPLEALPMPLRAVGGAGESTTDGERLTIAAPARSDWFVPPGGGSPTGNAPALVGDIDGDYLLSARVEVEFRSTFDAGSLVVFAAPDTWAKLAFEYSPQRKPMVVSVVTRERSDDANAFVVEGESIWLRIAKLGTAYAFHASTDGTRWELVRHFTLGDDMTALGFEAQSPLGEGCIATFDRIAFSAERLRDLRDGS
jgi:hypothetical protein